MAHGDPILNGQNNNWSPVASARAPKFLLLDGANSGTGDDATGSWVNVIGADDAGISVHASSVTTGATIQIRGHISTDGSAPSDSDDGFQVGADLVISADGEFDFAPLSGEQTLDYIKAIVSDYTDGTYSVPITVIYR